MTHATLLVRITHPHKHNVTHAPQSVDQGCVVVKEADGTQCKGKNARLVNGHTTVYACIDKCDNRAGDCAYCRWEGDIPTNWVKAFWGADICLNSEGKKRKWLFEIVLIGRLIKCCNHSGWMRLEYQPCLCGLRVRQRMLIRKWREEGMGDN
jgi:hypothetical protein